MHLLFYVKLSMLSKTSLLIFYIIVECLYVFTTQMGINRPSLVVGMGFLAHNCLVCQYMPDFWLCVSGTGLEKTQRQGVEELISAMPCNFDHASLFIVLQKHTLIHRMNDSFSCLVSQETSVCVCTCVGIGWTELDVVYIFGL